MSITGISCELRPPDETGKGTTPTLLDILTFSHHDYSLSPSFGGDPYLSGEAAFETITGIQSQGVQAVAKHFINKYVFGIESEQRQKA